MQLTALVAPLFTAAGRGEQQSTECQTKEPAEGQTQQPACADGEVLEGRSGTQIKARCGRGWGWVAHHCPGGTSIDCGRAADLTTVC